MCFAREFYQNADYLSLIMSIFCSDFANLLNYKKVGEVYKIHPCDPPKSRITGGGCHRRDYLEAGLKLFDAFGSDDSNKSQKWLPGSGFETANGCLLPHG